MEEEHSASSFFHEVFCFDTNVASRAFFSMYHSLAWDRDGMEIVIFGLAEVEDIDVLCKF